jgi:hypothetical protein
MTVFDKMAPRRADRAPSRTQGWRAAAGATACLLAALVAMRLGASETAVGIWLAVSVPAPLAWLVYVSAGDGRIRRAWRAAIVAAAYVTSSAAAATAILPGRDLGRATLLKPGDEVVIVAPEGGTTRIAVVGEMPHGRPGRVSYELRAGNERMLGAVERATSHIRIGETEQHRRREHGAAVYTVTLPSGQTRIVLAQLAGELVSGLRVAVFEPFVPTWAPASLAVVAFIVVVWLLATGHSAASAAMAAGVCVAFGVGASAIATPYTPLRGSLLALVAAVPLGIVGGVLWLAVVRRIKRVGQRIRPPERGRRRGSSS